MRVNTVITRIAAGNPPSEDVIRQALASAVDSTKRAILQGVLDGTLGTSTPVLTIVPAPEPTIEDAVAAAEKAAAQALRSLAWNARIASRDDATWKAYLAAVRKDDRAMATKLAKARKDMTGAQLTYDAALAATGGTRAKASA